MVSGKRHNERKRRQTARKDHQNRENEQKRAITVSNSTVMAPFLSCWLVTLQWPSIFLSYCQERLRAGRGGGGFRRGVFRSGLVLPLSFFGTFRFFPDFPICPGIVQGFPRLVLLLFLGLLTAPTRNSPERVRDTIRTFPENSGKPPGLETPGLPSPKKNIIKTTTTLRPA